MLYEVITVARIVLAEKLPGDRYGLDIDGDPAHPPAHKGPEAWDAVGIVEGDIDQSVHLLPHGAEYEPGCQDPRLEQVGVGSYTFV